MESTWSSKTICQWIYLKSEQYVCLEEDEALQQHYTALIIENLVSVKYLQEILQPIDACIMCVIKFNITTTCMTVFQNKCTHVITSFACYMTIWYLLCTLEFFLRRNIYNKERSITTQMTSRNIHTTVVRGLSIRFLDIQPKRLAYWVEWPTTYKPKASPIY